tara:strand:+ start:10449 stop:10655 length:207 start_codon:yes stop_codon:yes gene_type:complete
MEIKMYLEKYKMNLRVEGNNVYSYNTKVATIDHKNRQVRALGWWSVTTQKHINYVASECNYQSIKKIG